MHETRSILYLLCCPGISLESYITDTDLEEEKEAVASQSLIAMWIRVAMVMFIALQLDYTLSYVAYSAISQPQVMPDDST